MAVLAHVYRHPLYQLSAHSQDEHVNDGRQQHGNSVVHYHIITHFPTSQPIRNDEYDLMARHPWNIHVRAKNYAHDDHHEWPAIIDGAHRPIHACGEIPGNALHKNASAHCSMGRPGTQPTVLIRRLNHRLHGQNADDRRRLSLLGQRDARADPAPIKMPRWYTLHVARLH